MVKSTIGSNFTAGVVAAAAALVQLAAGQPAPTLGLSVRPGGMVLRQVKLGQVYDLYQKSGVALVIENRDSRPHTYAVSSVRPSEVGNRTWLSGYGQIPDPAWFWFEKNEVTVAAQSAAEVKMYLKIPARDEYRNQHWCVAVSIGGAGKTEGAVSLAVYPRYMIETESDSNPRARPEGALGIAPSLVDLEDVPAGKAVGGAVRIYNGSDARMGVEACVKMPSADAQREQIVSWPGHDWLPDSTWVSVRPGRLELAAGASAVCSFTIKIPDEVRNYGRKWDFLLFFSGTGDRTGFARVLVATGEKSATDTAAVGPATRADPKGP